MRRVAGGDRGVNDQPHDDHDPGEAEDSELDRYLHISSDISKYFLYLQMYISDASDEVI
jgi:hypothetical protein